MSYADAKEIALLRITLRACFERDDRVGALAALTRMKQVAAGNDNDYNELAAETRRWTIKLG